MVNLEENSASRPFLSAEGGLWSEDLRPTTQSERSLNEWEMAAFWVALVVGVPAYYLAGSLVESGMTWLQGTLTVMAGNLVLLLPLVLIGHSGTKYGIPFPVLCRAVFGIRGAHIPAIMRALVACGWFGIESWFCGQALFVLLNSLLYGRISGQALNWLGTSAGEFGCFLFFCVIQDLATWKGIAGIRKLEVYCAPMLLLLSVSLLLWTYVKAGGFGPMLSVPSSSGKGRESEKKFWSLFLPSLTANIGFFAPVALSISDFTRYARRQADQIVGQAGLPVFMGAFSFLGVAVTSSTQLIFGHTISNPIEIVAEIGGLLPTSIAITGIIFATLTTNIPANLVAAANTLLNLSPSFFTLRRALLLTSVAGIIFQPWRLVESSESFTEKWLVGYSALLGPIGGIIIVDYYALQGRKLNMHDLYSDSPRGQYWYYRGFNINALVSLFVGMVPVIPGFLQTVDVIELKGSLALTLYNCSCFVTFFTAGFLHWILSKLMKKVDG